MLLSLQIAYVMANSVDPDQMLVSVVSELILDCLSLFGDTKY